MMVMMMMVMTIILDPESGFLILFLDTNEDVYDENDEEVVLLIEMVFIAILETLYFCQYYYTQY